MKKITFRKLLFISVFLMTGLLGRTSVTRAQGTLTNLTFYSKSLQMNRAVQIYLPEGYHQDSTTRYPVIYYLHGAGENHTSAPQLISHVNSLIGERTILPVIIVKPDGRAGTWGRSYFTNSDLYGNFENYIVYDLVAFIDSAYNTIALRNKRAIMGWSMGGYGAMKCALKHPDIYCGVVAHAGMLNMRMCSQFIPLILSENGGAPVSAYHPAAGPWTYGSFAIAGAFSPNLNNPPYFVDYPLDSMGNWIDTVWNRWSLHNCPFLARNISQDDGLAIYFDCGTADEMLAYPFNTSFADSLDKLGLSYVFQTHSGSHDATNRYPVGLAFLDSVLHGIHSNLVNIVDDNPKSFMLFQNYPNPFNSTTTIQYKLEVNAHARLSVHDLPGRELEVLVNQRKPPGAYKAIFNAGGLASGIYFYKMQAQYEKGYNDVEIRKIVLIR